MFPLESLNLLTLNVGKAQHNGDWNWQNVSSPFTRIFLVAQGSAQLCLPGQTIQLRPGRMYLVPAHTVHSYRCDGPLTLYYLHIYQSFKNEADVFEYYDFPCEVPASQHDVQLLDAMIAQHPEAKLPQSDPRSYDNQCVFTSWVQRYSQWPLHDKMWMRGCLLMLFSRFLEAATQKPWTHDERMRGIVDHIQSHLCEDISIDTLSSLCCISRAYLIRLFKKHLGLSPLHYINQRRVERAQLLLMTSEMTVKQIAYSLGYNDHGYFIRLFRKYTGVTPLEYKRNIKN